MVSNGNEARRDAEKPVVVPATRARQAVTGHNVQYVLLAGTVAVIVLFAVVYMFYFG